MLNGGRFLLAGLEKYICEDHPELGSFKFPDPNGSEIKAYLVALFKKIGKEPKPPVTVCTSQGVQQSSTAST